MTEEDDPRRVRYRRLQAEQPFLFADGGQGSIAILTAADDIRAVEAHMAARLAADGMPTAWADIGVLHEDQYLTLVRDAVRFPDGRLGTYFRVLPPPLYTNVAAMLPVTADGVLLLRHFRHATRAWHLEMPRGRVDPGETPEAAARRELEEETGATPRGVVPLGGVHASTGLTSEHAELFLIEAGPPGAPAAGDGIAEIVTVPLDRFAALIADGTVTDSFTLAAWARATARGLL